ncbi:MAG: GntR family transcriptional regulator [Armatimonadota bacterium]|nr:GntR family transcriptional regulator [Armatimonadota bacterium]
MLDSINPKSAVPIHRQIGDQIRRSVAAGLLEPGDQLPSVRELAARLLVNPNTVAKVYRDLERDGLLETRRGQGTFISPDVAALAEADRRRLLAEQLEAAARDVHAFGLSEKAALDLFREVLANRRRGREDKQ